MTTTARSEVLVAGASDCHMHVFDPASTLARTVPQRCLWASNWPHVGRATPPREADLLALLHVWVPDAGNLRRILVDNPSQLYGFPPAPISTTSTSSLTN